MSKEKPKILLYDDESAIVQNLKSRLEDMPEVSKAFTIQGVSNEQIEATKEAFRQRQAEFRKRGHWNESKVVSDDAAIFLA